MSSHTARHCFTTCERVNVHSTGIRSRLTSLQRSVVAVATMFTALPVLHAQAAANAGGSRTFVYIAGKDTISTEVLSRSGTGWTGDMRTKGGPRLVWTQASKSGAGTFTLQVFDPNGAADAKPLQQASFVIRGDSAYIDIGAGANTQKQVVPTKAGAAPMLNNSLLQAVLLANSALARGASSFDVLLAQGGQTLGASVKRAGDTVVFLLQGTEMRARIGADGLPLEVRVPSQQLCAVPVGATCNAYKPAPPNYDAPASAPYVAEHVRIPSGRGYDLAATLTKPKGVQKPGVVVTISGSGPQERDSRIAILPGYAIFREIADTLGRRGIATLRFDDRAVGESGGAETIKTATTESFADDVRSVLAWLRKRPDIDASRIALVGHSEGGMIAPMVAASDTSVRAIALLAGPAYTGRKVVMQQNEETIRAIAGATEAQRDSIRARVPAAIDSVGRANSWYGYFLDYNPIPTARKVKQPVLLLQGLTDRQVSPEQSDTLAAALRSSGNKAVTVRKFPATNHLFVPDSSGAFAGYSTLKDVHVRRAVLGTLADWLSTQLGAKSP